MIIQRNYIHTLIPTSFTQHINISFLVKRTTFFCFEYEYRRLSTASQYITSYITYICMYRLCTFYSHFFLLLAFHVLHIRYYILCDWAASSIIKKNKKDPTFHLYWWWPLRDLAISAGPFRLWCESPSRSCRYTDGVQKKENLPSPLPPFVYSFILFLLYSA